jgi:transposase InsO family protein
VVAKVEWHPGELYPQVGFIVTNLAQPVKRLVAFYNHRGICEQYIKEGKGAVKWTRSRRMTAALRLAGHPVNRKRVQRLMRLMGLEALGPKPKTSRPSCRLSQDGHAGERYRQAQ